MKNYNYLIKKASFLRNIPQGRSCHISFILYKKTILSVGFNLPYKSHPLAKKFHFRFFSQHAELDAITNFNPNFSELKYCTMVNIRFRKDNGQIAMSKPCLQCQELLKKFGIVEIYYTTNSGTIERL